MNHRLIDALMSAVAPVVRDYFSKAIAPVTTRVDVLEKREPVKGDKGDPGDKGERGDVGEKGPQGEKGEPGVQGEPGEPGAAGSPGEKGEAGEKGLDGAAGKDGRDGIDGKDGAPGLQGEKGLDGLNGKDGRDGIDGKDGAPGERGLPGDRGEKGDPGRDGRDASDLAIIKTMIAEQIALSVADSLKAFKAHTSDDGRTIVLEVAGVAQEVRTGAVLDRGVWREAAFAKGDGVTWAGSFWIAQKDTATKPDTKDSDWRLAVKRGRDGKDGAPGKPGLIGPKGEKGDPGPRGYGG